MTNDTTMSETQGQPTLEELLVQTEEGHKGSLLARKDPKFSEQAALIREKVTQWMSDPTIDELKMAELCTEVVAKPHIQHDSRLDIAFYNALYGSIIHNLQSLPDTKLAVRLSCAVRYLDKIQFVGYALKFNSDIGAPNFPGDKEPELVDVRPMFDLWILDEDVTEEQTDDEGNTQTVVVTEGVAPVATHAFRLAVSKDLSMQFMPFDLSFLKKVDAQGDDVLAEAIAEGERIMSGNGIFTSPAPEGAETQEVSA